MSVTTTIEDGVAVVRMDDGKVNAVSHGVIDALHDALERAKAEATAVCVCGNDRAFSGGFDLSVMGGAPDEARALVVAGGELLMAIYTHPQPTVAAVTGHALAAGALLVLACDSRLGADKPAKIGLNEVAIGLPLPEYARELAQARLSPRFLTRAAVQAEIFDPAGAVEAGYLDRVEADCVGAAVAEARRLGSLSPLAYAQTKRAMRHPLADRVLASLRAGRGVPV